MSDVTTLVLTGSRKGTTCVLGKHRFVDGRAKVPMVGGVLRYMARIYAAFPEGSAALEEHNGNACVEEDTGGGPAVQVSGDVQQNEFAEKATDPSTKSVGGGGAGSEHSSKGDGQKHDKICEALTLLDKRNDDHWTQGGSPGVHIVSEILGEPVSRVEIEDAAPDFNRGGE